MKFCFAVAVNVVLLWALLCFFSLLNPDLNDLSGITVVISGFTCTVTAGGFISGSLLDEWSKDHAGGVSIVSFFIFLLTGIMSQFFSNRPLPDPILTVLLLTFAPLLLGFSYLYPVYWAGRGGGAFAQFLSSRLGSNTNHSWANYYYYESTSEKGSYDNGVSDSYAILGLKQGAGLSEVKARFRELAMIYHPDKSGNPLTAEMFTLIHEAYSRITGRKS